MIINTQFYTKYRPRVFYVYHEGYRSVTPLDAARVNRTIFHGHSVHWYYIITLIKGRGYIKQNMMLCFAMPTDLSFFRYEICIYVIWRNFGDLLIANIFKVMPEWIWPFSSSIELLVELFWSQNTINLKNVEKRQLWIRPMGVILIYKIYWKTSAVSSTCLRGWNSILQAAWYIRHVRMICFCELNIRYDY